MNSEAGPKIVTQNDAHIDPPERVGLDHDFPGAEHCGYCAGPLRITPPNDDSSQARRGICVTEKDDVDAV